MLMDLGKLFVIGFNDNVYSGLVRPELSSCADR